MVGKIGTGHGVGLCATARLTVRPLFSSGGSDRPGRSAAAELAGTATGSEAVRNGDLGRIVPLGYQTELGREYAVVAVERGIAVPMLDLRGVGRTD